MSVPAIAHARKIDDLSARVDSYIDRIVAEQRLVGTVTLIAQAGRVVYRRAAGLIDREARQPMPENAIFRFSSLTKPIVTAAALSLIESGELSLQDPVTRWLPAFRPRLQNGNEPVITVRQLLTHTAGLTYGFMESPEHPYATSGVSDGLDGSRLTMEEEAARIASVPLSYRPGDGWGYSVGLDVLGAVLERAANASLPDLIKRRVTDPLSLPDTGFTVTDLSRLAVPYADGRPPERMTEAQTVPFGVGAGIAFSPGRIFDGRVFPSGGAGMAGTADDFLTFLEAIRRGGAPILQPHSARAMMHNQIGNLRINVEPTPSWGFGFGGAVLIDPALAGSPLPAGAWRWRGAYGHHWLVDPRNEIVVVALSNTALEGMSDRHVDELTDAVYGVDRITPRHTASQPVLA